MKAMDEIKRDAFRPQTAPCKVQRQRRTLHERAHADVHHDGKIRVNAAICNMKPEHMAIVNPKQGDETTSDVMKTWAVEIEQDCVKHNERVKEHPGEKLAENDIIRAAVDKLTDTCPELKDGPRIHRRAASGTSPMAKTPATKK